MLANVNDIRTENSSISIQDLQKENGASSSIKLLTELKLDEKSLSLLNPTRLSHTGDMGFSPTYTAPEIFTALMKNIVLGQDKVTFENKDTYLKNITNILDSIDGETWGKNDLTDLTAATKAFTELQKAITNSTSTKEFYQAIDTCTPKIYNLDITCLGTTEFTYTKQQDIFSLGKVFERMGYTKYLADNLPDAATLTNIIKNMSDTDPRKRPELSEVAEALRKLAQQNVATNTQKPRRRQ
jgi:hypothetical protein